MKEFIVGRRTDFLLLQKKTLLTNKKLSQNHVFACIHQCGVYGTMYKYHINVVEKMKGTCYNSIFLGKIILHFL